MSGLALIAECNKHIGSGHVVETFHLSKNLKSLPWQAYLTKQTPKSLIQLFPTKPELIADLSPSSLKKVALDAKNRGFKAIALNALEINSGMVKSLQSTGLKVATLSVKKSSSSKADLSLSLDASNMILSPVYKTLAKKKRRHVGPIKKIMILMGGTDSSSSTAHLVTLLSGYLPHVQKWIIVGPNFAHLDRLSITLAKTQDRTFKIFKNPRTLAHMMSQVDVAITLGSDTSLELACVGTPTILMEEAPHERKQALFLAKNKCGIFLGNKKEVTREKLLATIEKLNHPAKRHQMSKNSKQLINTEGASRIAKKLLILAS